MKLHLLKPTVLALLLASLAAATAPAPAALGTDSDYTFRDAPLNSLGVNSLSELRGKPIVIDFWGRN
jgi:hypothetical protein